MNLADLKSKLGIREYVFVGMLVVIPMSMFMFVFLPRGKAIAQMSSDTKEMQKQLVEFRSVSDQAMVNIQQDITDLEKAVKYMDARVPMAPGTEKTIGDLSRLARKHELRTKKIRALTPIKPMTTELKLGAAAAAEPNKKEYEFRELDLELEGEFKNFYSFLQAVEEFPRIIHVEQVQLNKTEPEGNVEAKLKLRIFFREEQKEEAL